MELAVNYSPLLAEMVRAGQVRVDRFKCPSWPDLIKEAIQTLPVYVHFPLVIGYSLDCAVDAETKQPADLEQVADLLDMTGTRYVNTHFAPGAKYYPSIPIDSRDPRHINQVVAGTLRDLEPLIRRFSAERVLVENIINEYGWLTMSTLPEVIARVLEETGCGFLFDLSHARMVARRLGLDARAYSAAMPVEKIREIHITGIQLMEGEILKRIQSVQHSNGLGGVIPGQWMDHFPMTTEDWTEFDWLMKQLAGGKWGRPWTIAYECGGVGGFWEMVADREMYQEQLPVMAQMIERVR